MASLAILFRRIWPATWRNRFFGIFLMARPAHHGPPRDDRRRRVQDVLDRLRERRDCERVDDRREAEEQDDQREEDHRRREGLMGRPAARRELPEARERGERQAREEAEEGKRRQDRAYGREHEPRESDREAEASDPDDHR